GGPKRIQIAWKATLPLAAALALGIGGLWVIREAARPLGLLIVAITLAEAMEPLVSRLERRMARGLAIAVVILGLLLCLLIVGWLVLPTLVAQGEALVARAPQIVTAVQGWLHRADATTHGTVSRLVTDLATAVTHFVVSLPAQLFSAVAGVLVVIFLSIYWLAGAPGLARFTLSLVPPVRRQGVSTLVHDMGQAMGGYVRGAAINALVMAILAAIGLAIIGVNYPVALGVITGLGEPFPYIGPFAAAVPVVLVALVQSPTKALITLGFYCALQEFEGHILTPNIMERQTSIPQTLVILAIIVGAAVGGLLGIMVAIPLAAAIHVFALRVIAPAVRQATGAVPSGAAEYR
ncbi:MAG: AI-2E family transporter, partial [Solirubrobacteraceae bacterium]